MTTTATLDPGEQILWQGRPNARPFITLSQIGRVIRVLIAIVLLLYVLARLGYGLPPLTDIRVIVILIIFQAVPLEILKSSLLRRRTHYTLTTHRAIIDVDLPITGRVIRSFPILPETPIVFLPGRALSSLYFGEKKRKLWDLRGYLSAPGFERIREGERVFALIGQLQRGKP
jgi:hypothetical protein